MVIKAWGCEGQDEWRLLLLLPAFTAMAVSYAERHNYDLTPDLTKGRPLCEGESEGTEEAVILLRETVHSRAYTKSELWG